MEKIMARLDPYLMNSSLPCSLAQKELSSVIPVVCNMTQPSRASSIAPISSLPSDSSNYFNIYLKLFNVLVLPPLLAPKRFKQFLIFQKELYGWRKPVLIFFPPKSKIDVVLYGQRYSNCSTLE